MPTFNLVRVMPRIPPKLAPLTELAYNLHWAWDPVARSLFQRLDPALWERSDRNPVRLLADVSQERLEEAAKDPGFLTQLERAYATLAEHKRRPPHPDVQALGDATIAYFCFEFGLATCLPIYSGGLGVLAGDTIKSASDLGLPIVGVGIHYSRGYFRQYLNSDGWQQQEFADVDYSRLPIVPERRSDGSLLAIDVPFPGRTVRAHVWRIQVGRAPIYLLDTNVPQNRPDDRVISDRLYGGDTETRIQQELLLGIGGIRLLDSLGIKNPLCHMNEGHSAFLGLERVRLLMREHGLRFQEAQELATASSVFTTHTPEPAGIDMFGPDLIDRYFGQYWGQLGLTRDEFYALGRQNPNDQNEPFSMAVLGIRLSNTVNGVSKLHGQVARTMWQGLWPDVPKNNVPIGSVTNGIHHRSWISSELVDLFERYVGIGWLERPADRMNWTGITRIPNAEIWRAHQHRREQLVAFARDRYQAQLRAMNASPSLIDEAGSSLDPTALTIGFARRFARYKRATLLFRNPDRLARLLNDPDRPVQIIIAGKAHPQDEPGKELIREIFHIMRRPEFRRRVVFIENYDMTVARMLMQGCDIWLNTPLRPREASGTSGMKASANGVLHLSIADGWWAEAYRPGLGWVIGGQEEYPSLEMQNDVESRLLYDLLEQDVIPTFFDRGRDGVPHRWAQMMKNAIMELTPYFNTDRMVLEYLNRGYLPGITRFRELMADNQRRARELAQWKQSIRQRWGDVRIERVDAPELAEALVGSRLTIRADLRLGSVSPNEVIVQAFYGPVDSRQHVIDGRTVTLDCAHAYGDGRHQFVGEVPLDSTGMVGYGVRVLPRHPDLADPFELRLIRWA